MRPIKFRAWDKTNKKMRYFDTCWLFGEYQSIAWRITEDSKDPDDTDYCLSFDNEDLTELMQFTGLTDKTKKPIYEGDVVKSFDGIISEIIWNESVAAFSDTNGDEWGMIEPSFIEVIGNIYENPELLK